MSRVISRTCLLLLLSAMVGLGTAAGQQDDWLEGDVPQWLEDFGYEDSQEDGPVSEGTTQAHEGDSGSVALRAGQCSGAACDCFLCRDKLTGDWCGHRSCLQQNGIVYRGRVTQFFFGVAGGVQPPVPPPYAAMGIAGGDTFEYTGNSRHDFLVSLDKFGGPPHGKFVVTLENVWGRWGNVSQETGSSIPAVFNAVMPVDPEAQGVPRVTNFLIAQPLSEQFILTAGKARLAGVADDNIFAGGDGSAQFVNMAFNGNPLFVGQLPLSVFAVGAQVPQQWGNVAVFVIDPQERSTDFMDLGTLFAEGMLIFGQVKVNTDFFSKPGEQHVAHTTNASTSLI